jgi:hypothetical protein
MKLSEALAWLETQEIKDDNNEVLDDNICLISRQEIVNPFTLKCGHKFDYINLFKELRAKITRPGLQVGFCCPYCRVTFPNFIPYYEMDEMVCFLDNKNKYGSFKNDFLQCNYKFKSGKRKGKQCDCHAHKFKVGTYCFSHHTRVIKNTEKKSTMGETKVCGHICKNGKPCTKKVSEKYGNEKCGIHGRMLQIK